ncbi:MAG: hypothetical protein HY319_21375 [Armatimonadetes bacterium]|nr:hypothetical protein [Armatimonadota bacterium]
MLTTSILGGMLVTAASETLAGRLGNLAWFFPPAAGVLLAFGVRALALSRVYRAGVAVGSTR